MDPIQNWGITRLKMYTENIVNKTKCNAVM